MTALLGVLTVIVLLAALAIIAILTTLTTAVQTQTKATNQVGDKIAALHTDLFEEVKKAEAAMAREEKRRLEIARAVRDAARLSVH